MSVKPIEAAAPGDDRIQCGVVDAGFWDSHPGRYLAWIPVNESREIAMNVEQHVHGGSALDDVDNPADQRCRGGTEQGAGQYRDALWAK